MHGSSGRRLRGRGRPGRERRLGGSDAIDLAARAEGLFLQQRVANAAEVNAEFYGVVPDGFCPDICDVNIRFRTNPGKAGRESDEWIGVGSSVDRYADDAASDVI